MAGRQGWIHRYQWVCPHVLQDSSSVRLGKNLSANHSTVLPGAPLQSMKHQELPGHRLEAVYLNEEWRKMKSKNGDWNVKEIATESETAQG